MILEFTAGLVAMLLLGFHLGYSTRREEEEFNREIQEWRKSHRTPKEGE
jgi:hypothetical protein